MQLRLVLFGFLVHLIFFYSIFDIYFTSPIVRGMTPQYSHIPAPAKRVVLLVGDGLRADRCYEKDRNGLPIAPYLREIIESKGVWGVSHTRVPTESRPGHVAIIAGFYEDVSAVSKGWKENPVEFDSLFNESYYTWSWGSPDILPMFAKGASEHQHIATHCYSAETEDFATAESSKLDTWVFDHVEKFFEEASQNSTLANILAKEKIAFFLHLLGIDTVGHSRKPHSKEYYDNIRIVDEGIHKMEQIIENYFNHDGQTAYIMTADHGMTDWGSHGAGHPSETLTPLIAWGAGIRKPLFAESLNNSQFVDLKTDIRVQRHDVNQADLCPLMAALIGVPFPMNSVGILPVELLNTTPEFKAEALFANAKQILAQFEIKMQQKQDTTLSLLFVPFRSLTSEKQEDLKLAIQAFIDSGDYKMSILKSHELIDLSLQGLKYYHNYDRFFLGVVCGFCGWIAYIVSVILRDHADIAVRQNGELSAAHYNIIRIVFFFLGLVITALMYAQSLPFTHYLYCLLPVLLWYKVIVRWTLFADIIGYIRHSGSICYSLGVCVLAIVGIEIMVLGIFWREVFSLAMLVIAFYPWMLSLKQISCITWSLTYCSLAVFPLLPVIGGKTVYSLVYVAGFAAFLMGFYCLTAVSSSYAWKACNFPAFFPERKFLICQLFLIPLSIYIVWSTSSNIANKLQLPLLNQILSWIIAAWSFLLPVLVGRNITVRLCAVILGFLPTYFLLSIAQDGLFCIILCCAMLFWLRFEATLFSGREIKDYEFSEVDSIIGQTHRKLNILDLRLAFCFIFFLLFAFFGTGNIASINSFDPASVYCFLTVFNPFVMGALMLWKILIPFLLVTCVFNAIHVVVELPMQSLFLLVLLMSDIMAVHFFFLVRDEGSWLDIGTSISHYVVVMSLICFLFLLLVLSHIFTRFSLFNMIQRAMRTKYKLMPKSSKTQ